MKTKLFGTVCVLSALAVIACGDDESGEGGSGGSTTTTTGTGTSTKSGSTSTMGTTKASSTTGGSMECPLPDTTDTMTCEEACPALYDCGALTCNGATLCMFTGMQAEKDAFVDGCLDACGMQMALIGLIDEEDCESTITTLKGVNAMFADTCDNGIGAGGGGG
jgi:hypothetical protein